MLRLLIDRHAGAACIIILLGFAFAAFYPFDPSPENRVSWIGNAGGLRFERGSVRGPAASSDDPTRPCSIEIWARPARSHEGVLADFFTPQIPNRLMIEESDRRALWVRHENESTIRDLWVPYRFDPNHATLLSIVSDIERTRVYVDAALVDVTSAFRASMADCTSDFVLGSGSRFDSTWDGDLLGFALYDRALDAAEVERHHEAWREGRATDYLLEPRGNGPVTLYVFDAQSDTVIRDRTGRGRDLFIPETLEVPLSSFLAWPRWVEIRMNELDWQDIAINIAGFIPFGFFACAFVASLGTRSGRLVLATLALGFLVSLTIEIAQSWLPSRTSSMIDLLTNTLGATIGALLCFAWRRNSTELTP